MNEADWLARLRSREPAAFETLVRDEGGRMLAVARRLLVEEADAQDAVQDAFLSAFRAIDAFDGSAKLSTWLHRITVNAALMKLRTRKRRPERQIEDLLPRFDADGHRLADVVVDWSEQAEQALEREEARRRVRQLIDQLPDDYRTVLLLRDIEELDTEEAASVLGIRTGAVKTRLHRARQALRTLWERETMGAEE